MLAPDAMICGSCNYSFDICVEQLVRHPVSGSWAVCGGSVVCNNATCIATEQLQLLLRTGGALPHKKVYAAQRQHS